MGFQLAKAHKVEQLFHNEQVSVYPITAPFEKIDFWKENNRTVLAFDLLEAELKQKLADISLEEITAFLGRRPDMKLSRLAGSIRRNGVRVPLIALDDGTLLDGNRRYFACAYLYFRAKSGLEARPKVLDAIPVWVIRKADITDRLRQKILAEANFVEDYKVPWPLDVKARVISDYYEVRVGKVPEKDIYDEIEDVYGVGRTEVDAFVDAIRLSNEFVLSAPKKDRDKYRQHVQNRFLYFWEFRNKATKGRTALDEDELARAKPMFFGMIAAEHFDNFKQVEPMIRAVKDVDLWNMLDSSGGAKIEQVDAILKEQKAIRSSEDKVRNFLRWLKAQSRQQQFTQATIKLLRDVIDEILRIVKKG